VCAVQAWHINANGGACVGHGSAEVSAEKYPHQQLCVHARVSLQLPAVVRAVHLCDRRVDGCGRDAWRGGVERQRHRIEW
jgi:hypothetical protein